MSITLSSVYVHRRINVNVWEYIFKPMNYAMMLTKWIWIIQAFIIQRFFKMNNSVEPDIISKTMHNNIIGSNNVLKLLVVSGKTCLHNR